VGEDLVADRLEARDRPREHVVRVVVQPTAVAQHVPHRDPVVGQQPRQMAVDGGVERQPPLVDELQRHHRREDLGDTAHAEAVGVADGPSGRAVGHPHGRAVHRPWSSIRAVAPGAPCRSAVRRTPREAVVSGSGSTVVPDSAAAGSRGAACAGVARRDSRTAPTTVPVRAVADAIRPFACPSPAMSCAQYGQGAA
jgi:hypothetical protein